MDAVEEARATGGTTVETVVETETSETDEMTHHNSETTAVENVIWAGGIVSETVFEVEELRQCPEDRLPAEISENANSK